jgi:predicted transcriptional regulator
MFFKWLKDETKEKTEFGEFLEFYDIKQDWLAKRSNTSQSLISLLACNHEHIPKPQTANKILRVLREYEPNLKLEDFWEYSKKRRAL